MMLPMNIYSDLSDFTPAILGYLVSLQTITHLGILANLFALNFLKAKVLCSVFSK